MTSTQDAGASIRSQGKRRTRFRVTVDTQLTHARATCVLATQVSRDTPNGHKYADKKLQIIKQANMLVHVLLLCSSTAAPDEHLILVLIWYPIIITRARAGSHQRPRKWLLLECNCCGFS